MVAPKILFVDDDEDIRIVVRLALEDEFEVVEAEDVQSAWQSLEAAAPSLVLCDLEMPGESGFDLIRRMRADERFAHIPVVMLSGQAGVHHALEGMAVGTDDYIVKPFEPTDLLARIRFQLERPRDSSKVIFPSGGPEA